MWRSKKSQLINEDSSCPGEEDDTAPFVFLFGGGDAANLIIITIPSKGENVLHLFSIFICEYTSACFPLLFYPILALEDFPAKCVDKDKLHLVVWLFGWLRVKLVMRIISDSIPTRGK